MSKKFLLIVLCISMLFSVMLAACGNGEKAPDDARPNQDDSQSQTQPSDDNSQPETTTAPLEDKVSIEPDTVYDDICFSYTLNDISKGEWDWFNTIFASNNGPDEDGNEFMKFYNAISENPDSRVIVYITFTESAFENTEEATFDVGIQDTFEGNFGNFSQVRSNDVHFYQDNTIFTVSAQSLLDIMENNNITAGYAQLYIQFSGLTAAADQLMCSATVEVARPRQKDPVPENVIYSEPIFSYTAENVTRGDWDWFNGIMASYNDGYSDFVNSITSEGARVVIKCDLLESDFDPDNIFLNVGLQSTTDYGIISYTGADEYTFTDSGVEFSVSGARLLKNAEDLNIDTSNSQFYVQFSGVIPTDKSCNITVEVVVPQ